MDKTAPRRLRPSSCSRCYRVTLKLSRKPARERLAKWYTDPAEDNREKSQILL